MGDEAWGSLLWKKQPSIPALTGMVPGRSRWSLLPKYPARGIGVVYRLRFPVGGEFKTYIGLGVPSLEKRMKAHLASNLGTQAKMRKALEEGEIEVWLLSSESRVSIGEMSFDAVFPDKFELEMFEKVAIAEARRRLGPASVLNRISPFPDEVESGSRFRD